MLRPNHVHHEHPDPESTWQRWIKEYYRAHPNPVRPIHAIADVAFLTTEEGGRATPLSSGYRGQFYYDDHDWDAQWVFASDPVMPGEAVEVLLWFLSPRHHADHLSIGKEFLVREGNRTIGSGRITWLDMAAMSASDR